MAIILQPQDNKHEKEKTEMEQIKERAEKLINNVEVKYKIVGRRAGDIATCYADPSRAKEQLGWVATRGIDEMCRDSWNYAKKHMK